MLGKKKSKVLAGLISIFMLIEALLMPVSMAASTDNNQDEGTGLEITIPRDEGNEDKNLKRQFRYFKIDDSVKGLTDEELIKFRDKLDELSMQEVINQLGEGKLTPESTYFYNSEKKLGQDKIILDDIEPGYYLFKETQESSSKFEYRIITFIENINNDFKANKEGYGGERKINNQTYPKVTLNKDQPLELHKIAYSNDGKNQPINLEGVKFNLLDKDGNTLNFIKTADGVYTYSKEDNENASQELITNADGKIQIKNLDSGAYTFREIETINGFEIRNPDTPANYDKFDAKLVEVINYRPGEEARIHLHKTDAKTGKALEGVGFRLYVKSGENYIPVGLDKDGNYQIDKNVDYIFNTDKDGNIILSNLPELSADSSYVFREVGPLEGYVSSTDSLYQADKNQVLEVKNYKTPININLKKINSVTKKPIDRVGFELYRKKVVENKEDKATTEKNELVGLVGADGKYDYNDTAAESDKVYQLYTDANGEINVSGLADGDYYFKENKVKEDYKLAENEGKESKTLNREHTSDVVENRPVTPPPVTPPENPTGSYSFVKVDDSKEKNRLEGAVFALYTVDKDGKASPYEVDGKRYTVRSGSNGEFKVEGLAYGKYYLRETAAPDGYVLDVNPIEFTISEESKNAEAIFIVNKKTPNKQNTPPVVNPPGTPTPPSTPNTPNPTPSTTYYVPKDTPAIPRGPLVKTGDIRIVIFVAIGLVMIIAGSHLVRKSEKAQVNLSL
ncbi:collagen binding domain-containing protein [uncultured Anaerococcus sp.]|uniref:MSCRAMM family protein n=1 Tax=uncultured Anaerococcus sp. TaxID=293428 RepID=UPI00262600CA|nr:SpaA isopeptide-forming pilin-related protein [uncultured Anaerococcus sp.]